MRIESSTPLTNLAAASQRQNTAAEQTPEQQREGIRVSLSELSKSLSASAGEKNKDIDESGLPDSTKDLLKMIRKLKAEIAAKQAELRELMADQGMDPETKRAKADGLQTQLASLNSALSSANANLIKQIREQGLSGEQAQVASSLAMG
jgi:chromosome segregation ATPase